MGGPGGVTRMALGRGGKHWGVLRGGRENEATQQAKLGERVT